MEKNKLSVSDWISLSGIFVSIILAIVALLQAYQNSQQDVSIKNFSTLLDYSQKQIDRLTVQNDLLKSAVMVMDSNLKVSLNVQIENKSKTKYEIAKERSDFIKVCRQLPGKKNYFSYLLTAWKRNDRQENNLLFNLEEIKALLDDGLSNRYLLANEALSRLWENLNKSLHRDYLSVSTLTDAASLQADNVDMPEYFEHIAADLELDDNKFESLLRETSKYIKIALNK